MCRMGDLAALSRTGARVPCLKARIPSRLPWTELRSPRLAVHPCAKPMDRALRPPLPRCAYLLNAHGPHSALPPPGCASMLESHARNLGLVGTHPGRERGMVECTLRRRLVSSSAISASPCGTAEERWRTWRRRRSQRRRRCRCRAQWPRRPSNRTRAPHARY